MKCHECKNLYRQLRELLADWRQTFAEDRRARASARRHKQQNIMDFFHGCNEALKPCIDSLAALISHPYRKI